MNLIKGIKKCRIDVVKSCIWIVTVLLYDSSNKWKERNFVGSLGKIERVKQKVTSNRKRTTRHLRRFTKKIRGQHIMKKALIICAAGMSSSVIARKTTAHLKEQGNDIEVNATSQSQGATAIAKDEYDLYLVSPQTKMYFNTLETAAKKQDKPIVNIPPQAYVPIPMGIEKLSKVITDHI